MGGAAANQQTNYRSKSVYEGSLTAHLAGVNSALASGGGSEDTATGDAIERQRQAFIASGGRPDDFDRNAMELVAAKSVEMGNEKLLGFFDRKVPGKDYTYGETPDGSKLKQQAVQHLTVRARQAVIDGDKAAEKERQQREDLAQRAAVDAMVAGEPVPEEILAAGEKADPLFRTKVGQWKENLAKGARDPALVRQIKNEIVTGGGIKAVISSLPSIESGDDLSEVVTFAKSFEGARATIDDVLGSTSAKTIFSNIDSRTKKEGSLLNPVTGMSNEGMEAQYDFRMVLMRWATENPNATTIEREEAIARIGTLIMGRFEKDPKQPGVMNYNRDGEAVGGFANPYTDLAPGAPAPVVKPAAPPVPKDDRSLYERVMPSWLGGEDAPSAQAESTPTADPAGLSPEDRAFFNGFTPEQQKELEAGAKGNLPGLLEHIRKQGAGPAKVAPGSPKAAAPDGTPVDPAAFQPSRQADLSFLSSRAIGGAKRPDSFTGMRPEFASGVEALIRSAPPEIARGLQVMSGYRSPEKQAQLYRAALQKYGSAAEARKWVAPAGRSGHNHGHAADLAFNGVRLDKAPAHVRQWVHENAGKFGLAFPLGNEAWHVELAGARDGGGGKARRSFTQKDAESFLSAALDMDPLDLPGADREEDAAFVPGDVAAGRLLDLIGQHEAGGNYNAVFGQPDATRDLGKFTLDAIIAQQERAKDRGAYSTAIGKYQFLQKTLKGLKEEMGLTGAEPFDPPLQDRLALALLERRGYSAFKAGRLSKRAFALRLSQEWSSLPDPNTGRSFYHGDGVNRATARSRDVYAQLGFVL
ncbi:D-alanyl-D-alanine carboxypeptidase family protein [Aureimonas sp. D3]|uniref:D-alanyl-D-alanine carboxypeptidase family protein n=1 Tax=Aureimonas sp. D3 TaxID=1638164 RepID=UPI001AEC6455|nr:D-alanyl-D-alanine carboxypeptidase family protein [Aureimonas sp. D3]